MTVTIFRGDCRTILPTLEPESVNCVVTSPPYWGLRDYGVDGQLGLEQTPGLFVAQMVEVFGQIWRVLRKDGTLWLNLGDSYSGSGKGGNPDPGSSKQATNKGSQTIGTLYGKTGELARQAALTNVSRRLCAEQGIPRKQLIGIPWRVAFALQEFGWYLRQDIIWSKPNPMPESVTDRCTKAHEYIFMFSKSLKYYYDQDAIAEPAIYSGLANQTASGYKDAETFNGKHKKTDKQRGHGRRHAGFNDRWDAMSKAEQCSGTRNKRSVWEVATAPFPGAHFATFPPDLIKPCVLAGCPENGTVLDPFGGAGTTGLVADRLKRNAVLIELNPEYVAMSERRIQEDAGLFSDVAPIPCGD